MEFDRRRTRWTHVAMYLIYLAVMGGLLINSNPYLYSHKELRQSLVGEQINSIRPVKGVARTPAKPGAEEAAGAKVTYWWRSTPERTGHDQGGSPREKDFVTDWQRPLLESVTLKAAPAFAVDDSGVYLTSEEPWVVALTPDGDPRWRFRFAERHVETSNLPVVLDNEAVYVAESEGSLVTLEKLTGHLLWRVKLANKILTSPVVIDDELWVLVTPLDTERKRLEANNEKPTTRTKAPPTIPPYRFVRLKSLTGELVDYSQPFPVSNPAPVTWAREAKLLLVSTSNQLHMINQEDGKLVATQTLPDPIEGPAVVVDDKAYLALTSGKVQSWDLSKRGKFEWEVDLGSPPRAAPSYVPVYNLLAVPTSDGSLHTIDLKKSEPGWRLNADNHNPQTDIWVARLSGKFIEKLSMKWEKKGWTIWAPCSDNRFCVYNPDKGQLLARIAAPGAVASAPAFVGKGLYLISREGKGPYSYKLVHYLDEDSFKKKAKQAQETAAGTTPSASRSN